MATKNPNLRLSLVFAGIFFASSFVAVYAFKVYSSAYSYSSLSLFAPPDESGSGNLIVETGNKIDLSIDEQTGKSSGKIHTYIGPPQSQAVGKGLKFLADSQFENGGWGAGSHSRQDVTDPKSVQMDPATTAFCALSFIRSGSTLAEGPYAQNVNKALFFMLETVESAPKNSHNITTLTGTQPQSKLGQNIDVSLASQFLTRVLDFTTTKPELDKRIREALAVCIQKIQNSQNTNGSFAGGSWAPVLQSAMANNALEYAKNQGIEVNDSVLLKSRNYQAGYAGDDAGIATISSEGLDSEDFTSLKSISSGSATYSFDAGVELYNAASAFRANAPLMMEAESIVAKGKKEGKIKENATITKDNLMDAGVNEDQAEEMVRAYKVTEKAQDRLNDETVISGFGNNGGEEYLSHMMTGESMVVSDDKTWNEWSQKTFDRITKVQNGNGSWSGHHCITSPVFCTAAVIMTLSVENEKEYLLASSQNASKTFMKK